MSTVSNVMVKHDQKSEMLDTIERADLLKHESTVRVGMKHFVAVGKALDAIRDGRLYRETHATFGEYCQDRWGLSESQANRLRVAARVADDLQETTPIGVVFPTSESQLRPLGPLDRDERREAYAEAVEQAGGKAPTAKQVTEAAARVTAKRGKPLDDPVAEGRRLGKIPEGAEVEVDRELPPDETRPQELDDLPADEPFDPQAWLQTLPARPLLSDPCRRWFDAEALAFHQATPARLEYRNAAKKHLEAAKKTSHHIGPWMSRHYRYLTTNDPSRWRACPKCKGEGSIALFGECADCHGHGYTIH